MNKLRLPSLLYYLIVGTITELILLCLAGIVLLPTGMLTGIAAEILTAYLLYYGLKVAFLTGFISRWSDLEHTTKVVGMLPGRMVGIFSGGALGYWLGGLLPAIVTGILFYLVGRWLGARLSDRIGEIARSYFDVRAQQPGMLNVLAKRMKVIFFIYLAATATYAGLIFGFKRLGITIDPDPTILPYARAATVLFSAMTVGTPWLFQGQLSASLKSQKAMRVNPEFMLFFLGLAVSITPAVFGMFLYLLGGELLESLVYMSVSILAMSLWANKMFAEARQAGL